MPKYQIKAINALHQAQPHKLSLYELNELAYTHALLSNGPVLTDNAIYMDRYNINKLQLETER